MLSIIDKLAGKWLDWRTEHAIKLDPELTEMGLHSLELKENGLEVALISPAVAHLADMMSELLVSNHAENFVSFELLPRLDRGSARYSSPSNGAMVNRHRRRETN